MILYFSATGNSKYVAKRIAQACSEESLSIVDCIR
ncbi:MAG: flavodoxin domain-containing protein [Galactobacillus timonensis]|jgi:flavodoxin|nr:flavodoxin domain-containing protein [Galactobacillus timonensis]